VHGVEQQPCGVQVVEKTNLVSFKMPTIFSA